MQTWPDRSARNLGGDSCCRFNQSDNSAFGQSLGQFNAHASCIGLSHQSWQAAEQQIRGEARELLQHMHQLPNRFKVEVGVLIELGTCLHQQWRLQGAWQASTQALKGHPPEGIEPVSRSFHQLVSQHAAVG